MLASHLSLSSQCAQPSEISGQPHVEHRHSPPNVHNFAKLVFDVRGFLHWSHCLWNPQSSSRIRYFISISMEAQAQPHTLQVSLQWDPTTDRFTLVHSVLLERALLPPGQWDLHFDEEGFGFVESHSSDDKNESLWVNDLFRRCLYKTDGGREVVLQSTAAGGEHSVSTFLSEQLLDFRSCVVRVPMGHTTGLEEVACNVRRPFVSHAGKGIFLLMLSLFV